MAGTARRTAEAPLPPGGPAMFTRTAGTTATPRGPARFTRTARKTATPSGQATLGRTAKAAASRTAEARPKASGQTTATGPATRASRGNEGNAGHAGAVQRAGRGPLLWEYSPPRAHPIVYACLLLFAVVFVTGGLENLAREQRAAIYAVYALPLLVTLLGLVAWYPSNVRIYEHGIAPSRALLLRWRRPFIHFDELVAIYPSYYDVTGAFVSPFASSDGKVTQLGLGLESRDGRVETVRFTPSRFQMWQPESRGYLEALDVVKQAWGDRPLVSHAESIDRAQGEAMLAQANKPFLPFFAIVLLFASAAPVLWLLTRPLDLPVALALPVALMAPVAVSVRSYVQSRRRHAVLDRLSKAAQWRKGQKEAAGAAGDGVSPTTTRDRALGEDHAARAAKSTDASVPGAGAAQVGPGAEQMGAVGTAGDPLGSAQVPTGADRGGPGAARN